MKKNFLALTLVLLMVFCLVACGHEWTAATCTAPKTCSVCNQTEGTALAHSYSAGICTFCGSDDPIYIEKINEAKSLIDSEDYSSAYEILEELGDYEDAVSLRMKFYYLPTYRTYKTQESNGKYSSQEYFYNDDGLLVQTVHIDKDGKKSVNDYTYDSNGNLITSIFNYFDGIKDQCDCFYDDSGNLIKKVYKHIGADLNEKITYIYTYSYDDKNNLIEYVYEPYQGGLIQTVDHYTYDSNGNLIKRITSAGGETTRTYDYEYDLNGNLIKETQTSSPASTFVYDYAYDQNNNLIKEVRTDSNGRKMTYDCIYNEEGNLIKEVYTDYNGKEITYGYSYDASGRLIKETYDNFNGEWSIYDFIYDEKGSLIKETYTGKRTSLSTQTTETTETTYKLVYIPYDISQLSEPTRDVFEAQLDIVVTESNKICFEPSSSQRPVSFSKY